MFVFNSYLMRFTFLLNKPTRHQILSIKQSGHKSAREPILIWEWPVMCGLVACTTGDVMQGSVHGVGAEV